MKSWDVTTTVTYAITAETADDAIALVDDDLEGEALNWSLPVAVEVED